jgi:hypothetical protein
MMMPDYPFVDAELTSLECRTPHPASSLEHPWRHRFQLNAPFFNA